MLKLANVSIIALVIGVALHVLLGSSWHGSFGSSNFFVATALTIISGLAMILPGFVTGLVAGERGLLHGALLSLGIFLYIVVKVLIVKSGAINQALDAGLRFLSVTAVAQYLVTSLAGVAVRRNGLFY